MKRALGIAVCALAACAREAAPEPARSVTTVNAVPPPATASTAPRLAPIRYLALGDSFTIGTGSSQAQAFPARLAARWQAAGRDVTLRNVAVNGFSTDEVLRIELPEVAPFAPTLVTLAVGANDIVRGSDRARYRAQVKRLLAAIVAAGVPAARVVALPQPDWSLSPVARSYGDPAALAREIEAFNAILREEAELAGARYVDLFPLMRQQARARAIAPDGLHPSAEAHDAWAEALAPKLPPE